MEYTISQQIHKIPVLLIPLLGYMGGIIIFFSSFPLTWQLVVTMLFFMGISLFFLRNKKILQSTLLVTVFAIGGLMRCNHYLSQARQFPYTTSTQEIIAQGTIHSYSFHPDARFKHCLTMQVNTIVSGSESVPVNHMIQIYCRIKPTVSIADEIKLFHLRLKHPKNDDFSFYLLKEGISGSTFLDRFDYLLIKHPRFSLHRWINEKRESLFKQFKARLSNKAFALFSSLFLGYREVSKREKEEMQNSFKQWGISHYLARSGLHLVIIISLTEFMLRLLPIVFILKQLFLMIAALIYFLLTWSSVSFIRAFFIFFAYKYCLLARIPTHFLHVLIFCCLFLLIINPFYLYFLDFQLSFGLTFAMAWLNQFKITPIKQS